MNSLRRKYEEDFLRWDFVFSVAILFAALLAIYLTVGITEITNRIGDSKSPFYSSIFSLAGCLLGFLISAASIVIAFGEMPRFKLLRESGQTRNMATVFFNSMRWLTILCVVSLGGLLIDTKTSPVPTFVVAVFWLSLICSLRVYRCVWILKKLTFLSVNSPSKSDRAAA